MKVEETKLAGCFIIEPKIFKDDRGYFFEKFNSKTFEKLIGIKPNFVQDNQSKSSKGVLRGLHFQVGDYAQAKLVSVTQGSVLDVAVDIRPNSKTFGEYVSIILDTKSHNQMYVPRGFAHGFLVLEDNTTFSYKCDNFYNKDFEKGIIYNDKTINIDWGLLSSEIILSKKDQNLPTLNEFLNA